MRIDITDNIEQAEQLMDAFGSQGARGVSRAINRAVMGIRTDVVKVVRRDYNVKAAVVRRGLKVRQARGKALEGAAIVSGSRIPLIQFRARPATPDAKRPPGGVSVHVKSARKAVRHAFIAQMGSGHIGVFQRQGAGSLPISEKFSYAVPEMLDQADAVQTIEDNAVQRFSRTLDHQMNYLLQKMGAR